MNVNGQIVTLYPLSIFSLDTDNLILNQNESNLTILSLSNRVKWNILLSLLIIIHCVYKNVFSLGFLNRDERTGGGYACARKVLHQPSRSAGEDTANG